MRKLEEQQEKAAAANAMFAAEQQRLLDENWQLAKLIQGLTDRCDAAEEQAKQDRESLDAVREVGMCNRGSDWSTLCN